MNIPSEFDPIRPFTPEELPAVYDRLLADPQFQQVITSLFPGVSLEDLGKKMKSCKTNLEFQKAFAIRYCKTSSTRPASVAAWTLRA